MRRCAGLAAALRWYLDGASLELLDGYRLDYVTLYDGLDNVHPFDDPSKGRMTRGTGRCAILLAEVLVVVVQVGQRFQGNEPLAVLETDTVAGFSARDSE